MKLKIQLSISALLMCFSFVLAQKEPCPCCTEAHKAFDFWIGTWNVTNPDGTIAGMNTIAKIQGDCVIRENWVGTNGNSTGTSMNYYNLKTKEWEQLWVDNSGTHLKLKGNRIGNRMILTSDEFTHTDGNTYVNRITWTSNSDGTVHQIWELLQDGKVVKIAFDGLYRKVS